MYSCLVRAWDGECEIYCGGKWWQQETPTSLQVDVFSMDLVLYPIHLGTHWCLAAIDNRQQSLTYYDSLGGRGKSCLAKLRDYLLSEYRDKKKAELSLNGWRDVPVNVSHYYTEPWNPNENFSQIRILHLS